jgi:hypothetical protein
MGDGNITLKKTIQLRLDLSRHCVQTEIKRQYSRALSLYFKSGQDRQHLEALIELTPIALTCFDFGYLRQTWPPLAGQSTHDVVLEGGPDTLTILVDGRPVETREYHGASPG